MKPKLLPDLEKYFAKEETFKPPINWYNYTCDITYNNMYFIVFTTFFILFLCYRYSMKKQGGKFKSVKIRRVME
jgi:type II secretory pathway component PulF